MRSTSPGTGTGSYKFEFWKKFVDALAYQKPALSLTHSLANTELLHYLKLQTTANNSSYDHNF